MNADTQSLRDDLAFLRALVQTGEDNYRPLAEAYLAGGLVYGGEMLLHAGQVAGIIPSTPLAGLLAGVGPTFVFLVALTFIVRRNRRVSPSGDSTVGKAIGTAFGSIGLSNLALMATIGAVALREHSLTVWLIYPCTVFVLQGTAWLFAFTMRRHTWHGFVALGWFATAIGMGICITQPGWFILLAGLGLFCCMALPGYAMLRQHSKTA